VRNKDMVFRNKNVKQRSIIKNKGNCEGTEQLQIKFYRKEE